MEFLWSVHVILFTWSVHVIHRASIEVHISPCRFHKPEKDGEDVPSTLQLPNQPCHLHLNDVIDKQWEDKDTKLLAQMEKRTLKGKT